MLYNDDCANLNFIRINLLEFSVYLDICIIRADIHQFADVPAALSDSIALEQFADLIKQHNSYALRILAKQNGTDRCNSHQKVFIKYLFVQDSLPGLFQDIVSDDQIRNHKGCKSHIAGCRQYRAENQKNRCNDDADENLFLFLIHTYASFVLTAG